MTYEEGSLCEPLAVALAGLERANVKLGDPVVIWYVQECSFNPSIPPRHSHFVYSLLYCLLPSSLWTNETDMSSGAGPIGLVTALAANAAGCTPIVLTDLVASRLEFAKTLLPNIRTVQIPKGTAPEGVAELIKDAAGGMVNVALECTGFESSIRAAIFVSLSMIKDLVWRISIWIKNL